MTTVVILDYGSGNVRSAQRAVETTGASVTISADFELALNADALLVPGVGAFAACVTGLKNVRGDQIIGRRLAGGRPVLGICVGMQVLFENSTEHADLGFHAGLNEWPGTIEKLNAPVLPHMGWNDVKPNENHPLFKGLEQEAIFYFLHSFYFKCKNLSESIAVSDYGITFTSAVNNDNVYGIQFHPEKSHQNGEKLLHNFAKL